MIDFSGDGRTKISPPEGAGFGNAIVPRVAEAFIRAYEGSI
jgi:hypothetical protein